MRRLLAHTVLIAWLIAILLPVGWVFLNSMRSSAEFVENPFGIPWAFAGMPVDAGLTRVELQRAADACGQDRPDSIPCDLIRLFQQRFDTLDRNGDRALSPEELARLNASNEAYSNHVARLFDYYELSGMRRTAWDAAIGNYVRAWVDSGFSRYFLNSIIVTLTSLLGILAIGAMASYVIARFPSRAHGLLYIYFISGLMIPAQLVLVPLFFQFTSLSRIGTAILTPFGLELQLHDSLFALIVIYIALSLPFTVLVLTGFFKTLPGELREAAIMDGCGEFRVFAHVMLPLARPGLVTAAVLNFIGLWNEYLFALVFVNAEEKKTLPLGLASVSMQAQYKTDFGLMFAGLVIVIVPTMIVYIVLQRRLTEGITVGALKG